MSFANSNRFLPNEKVFKTRNLFSLCTLTGRLVHRTRVPFFTFSLFHIFALSLFASMNGVDSSSSLLE